MFFFWSLLKHYLLVLVNSKLLSVKAVLKKLITKISYQIYLLCHNVMHIITVMFITEEDKNTIYLCLHVIHSSYFYYRVCLSFKVINYSCQCEITVMY